jgi:N-acetylneuraminic acid mutarotase
MSTRTLTLMAGATIAAAPLCLAASDAADLHWTQLPPVPGGIGVAGAYAGVTGGRLLVAGGANFPDKMPWEGGKKVWHDTVYALPRKDGSWELLGRLPRPLGYGVSVTTRSGVLCIGGSDSNSHHADAFLLTLSRGKLVVRPMPALPLPLANGAGAVVGNRVYVTGGSSEPGERSALNRLFALDLGTRAPVWKELGPCPGEPRILPVAGSAKGWFYVAGGAALKTVNGSTQRIYLRDAWRFHQREGWQQLPDLPRPCVAGPSPAPVIDSTMLFLGGDDGSLAGFKPPEKHPGFPKSIQAFDLRHLTWSQSGEAAISRATLPVTEWQGNFVLVSGEARPGVRSPEVWTLQKSPDR